MFQQRKEMSHQFVHLCEFCVDVFPGYDPKELSCFLTLSIMTASLIWCIPFYAVKVIHAEIGTVVKYEFLHTIPYYLIESMLVQRDKTFDGQSNVVEIIMRESAQGTIGETEAVDKLMKMIEQTRTEVLQLLLTSKSIAVDAKGFFLMSIRISLLSTDTSHPFAKCLQSRPEQMPDNNRSWAVPVLREFNKQLQEIVSL